MDRYDLLPLKTEPDVYSSTTFCATRNDLGRCDEPDRSEVLREMKAERSGFLSYRDERTAVGTARW